MTLLNAGALTDPQLPATASNVCTTDARRVGVGRVAPPNKNPGYAMAHLITSLVTLSNAFSRSTKARHFLLLGQVFLHHLKMPWIRVSFTGIQTKLHLINLPLRSVALNSVAAHVCTSWFRSHGFRHGKHN